MKVHTCTECNTPVAHNAAVLRSAGDFTAVTAWHRDCWELRGIRNATRATQAA